MGFEVGFSYVEKQDGVTFEEMLRYSDIYGYDAFVNRFKPQDLDNWCSMARGAFDNTICETLQKADKHSYYFLINKNNINALYNIIKTKVDNLDLVPVIVTHSIRQNDEDMILTPIDGIQVELEDGQVRQLFFTDYGEDTVYISKSLADYDTVMMYKSLLDCLRTIQTLDLDKYFVYYWRSW